MGDNVFINLPLDVDVEGLGYGCSTSGELDNINRPNSGFYL